MTESAAKALIVNGFFEPFSKELPMEYAVELNKLLELEMEGLHRLNGVSNMTRSRV